MGDPIRRDWERQDGEPPQWFARFTAYRLLGRQRTVQAVWDAERKGRKAKEPSSTWRLISQEWRWQERAAAWDVHVAEEDAAKQAEQRRQLARAVFAKLARRIEDLDAARVTWKTYVDAMSIVFDELRTEYDQQPAAKLDVTLTFRQTIEQIAKARGIDPDDLERETDALIRELGIGA